MLIQFQGYGLDQTHDNQYKVNKDKKKNKDWCRFMPTIFFLRQIESLVSFIR